MAQTRIDLRPCSDQRPIEPTEYVWEQEDLVSTGDIARLVKAVELACYGDIAAPTHVLTFDRGAWQDVSVRTVDHGTDDDDWMHRELICSWLDRTESAFYTIDGRA